MYSILVKHKREKREKKGGGLQGRRLEKNKTHTQLDGWDSLSNVPIFILSQHFHQINQQRRTVVLHSIANISALSDAFKEVD